MGFEWADAILIGTPVYQGTLSGQAKVVLDKLRAFAARKPHALRRKVGAAVADSVKADEEGLKSLYKTVDRLIEVWFIMKGGEKSV